MHALKTAISFKTFLSLSQYYMCAIFSFLRPSKFQDCSNLFGGPNGKTCKSLFPWIAVYEEAGKDYVETNDFRVLCLRLVQVCQVI